MTPKEENKILAKIVSDRKEAFIKKHYPNIPKTMYLVENEVHKFNVDKLLIYSLPKLTTRDNDFIYTDRRKYDNIFSLREMLIWVGPEEPKHDILYSGSYTNETTGQTFKQTVGLNLYPTYLKALLHSPSFLGKISNYILILSMTMNTFNILLGGYKHTSTLVSASFFITLTVIMLLKRNK